MKSKKEIRRAQIKKSIRRRISGTAERPRMSVFRSNKEIYVQLIDDINGCTLESASSREIEGSDKVNKTEQAVEVGKLIAQKALDKDIKTVVFDRSGYLYHGRIKSLADAAREGGLKF
ncbi:MAG: 50S ribosomal protein L18 [Bacteroidales bacterium]|jgi:large subunit ribosomal protein L18